MLSPFVRRVTGKINNSRCKNAITDQFNKFFEQNNIYCITCVKKNMEAWDRDPDATVDQLIRQYDGTCMSIPDLECQPHLLISKVRKHYMEYVIKLLSVNYEKNQKLLNKNIYLPSAIWRCAKNIETSAVQSCMVVQLYRKNIQNVIKELKNDTIKGKLNKKLYECLHKPPLNEKKTQTNLGKTTDCNCQCTCHDRKKRRRISKSPPASMNEMQMNESFFNNNLNVHQMPKLSCSDVQVQPPITHVNDASQVMPIQALASNVHQLQSTAAPMEPPDDLAEKLEKLFQSDPTDDDLFEGTLCPDNFLYNDNVKPQMESSAGQVATQVKNTNNTVIEEHAAKIQSLNERVASLAGILASATENTMSQQNVDSQTSKQESDNQRAKKSTGKWLCEEYFLKIRLYELLDQIRESNRMGHMRIKDLFRDLFGDDSDDEGVVSPLEETPEFVKSCKERIAPWVVDLLTPYYVKGRIRGKSLFKALAKHLIRLIYQCSKYPNEYEVNSFVCDFLENHKMIRCEADYKQFRIDNL